jgi:hypothetical protein
MSLIKLPKYKLYTVCIYISPEGQFDKFFNKLDLVIQKLRVLKEDKILLLCGDWNMNFLYEDG